MWYEWFSMTKSKETHVVQKEISNTFEQTRWVLEIDGKKNQNQRLS